MSTQLYSIDCFFGTKEKNKFYGLIDTMNRVFQSHCLSVYIIDFVIINVHVNKCYAMLTPNLYTEFVCWFSIYYFVETLMFSSYFIIEFTCNTDAYRRRFSYSFLCKLSKALSNLISMLDFTLLTYSFCLRTKNRSIRQSGKYNLLHP